MRQVSLLTLLLASICIGVSLTAAIIGVIAVCISPMGWILKTLQIAALAVATTVSVAAPIAVLRA